MLLLLLLPELVTPKVVMDAQYDQHEARTKKLNKISVGSAAYGMRGELCRQM
jgi:hypothetical protein